MNDENFRDVCTTYLGWAWSLDLRFVGRFHISVLEIKCLVCREKKKGLIDG